MREVTEIALLAHTLTLAVNVIDGLGHLEDSAVSGDAISISCSRSNKKVILV